MTETTRKTKLLQWIRKVQIGNMLFALGTVGLMALSVVPLSIPTLIICGTVFVFLALVGKYIDECEDDLERLMEYGKHLKSVHKGCANESSCSVDNDSCRSGNLSQQQARNKSGRTGPRASKKQNTRTKDIKTK